MDPFRWQHLREPGALAHQFPTGAGWMTSRCPAAVRWSVLMWPAPPDAERCPDCVEMADAADERERVAVSAVATLAVR